jgi:hypothetical protein
MRINHRILVVVVVAGHFFCQVRRFWHLKETHTRTRHFLCFSLAPPLIFYHTRDKRRKKKEKVEQSERRHKGSISTSSSSWAEWTFYSNVKNFCPFLLSVVEHVHICIHILICFIHSVGVPEKDEWQTARQRKSVATPARAKEKVAVLESPQQELSVDGIADWKRKKKKNTPMTHASKGEKQNKKREGRLSQKERRKKRKWRAIKQSNNNNNSSSCPLSFGQVHTKLRRS